MAQYHSNTCLCRQAGFECTGKQARLCSLQAVGRQPIAVRYHYFFMRIFQLLTLIYLLASCRQEKDELVGHWHSTSSSNGSYLTLDITDSTSQVNKYGGGWYPEFHRYHEETRKEILVFDFDLYDDFKLINDTLIVNDQLKFLKVDEKHHLNDRFPNSLVRLNLPTSSSNPKVELPRPSQQAHLYIGPPNEHNKSYYYNADSTCFQTRDFIATGLIDLEYFIRQEDNAIAENENNWLIIHADSSISEATLDTLLSVIEPLDILNGYIVSRYNFKDDSLEYEELKVGNNR